MGAKQWTMECGFFYILGNKAKMTSAKSGPTLWLSRVLLIGLAHSEIKFQGLIKLRLKKENTDWPKRNVSKVHVHLMGCKVPETARIQIYDPFCFCKKLPFSSPPKIHKEKFHSLCEMYIFFLKHQVTKLHWLEVSAFRFNWN